MKKWYRIFVVAMLALNVFAVTHAYVLTTNDIVTVDRFETRINELTEEKWDQFKEQIIYILWKIVIKTNDQRTIALFSLLAERLKWNSNNENIEDEEEHNQNGEENTNSNEDNITIFEWEMLQAVNNERDKQWLNHLSLNEKLINAAKKHANYMKNSWIFSHDWPGRTTVADRVTAEWYRRSFVAENIARGQTTIEQVMDGRMHSAGHKANILSDTAQEIGVAHVGKYWVQVFGKGR